MGLATKAGELRAGLLLHIRLCATSSPRNRNPDARGVKRGSGQQMACASKGSSRRNDTAIDKRLGLEGCPSGFVAVRNRTKRAATRRLYLPFPESVGFIDLQIVTHGL